MGLVFGSWRIQSACLTFARVSFRICILKIVQWFWWSAVRQVVCTDTGEIFVVLPNRFSGFARHFHEFVCRSWSGRPSKTIWMIFSTATYGNGWKHSRTIELVMEDQVHKKARLFFLLSEVFSVKQTISSESRLRIQIDCLMLQVDAGRIYQVDADCTNTDRYGSAIGGGVRRAYRRSVMGYCRSRERSAPCGLVWRRLRWRR